MEKWASQHRELLETAAGVVFAVLLSGYGFGEVACSDWQNVAFSGASGLRSPGTNHAGGRTSIDLVTLGSGERTEVLADAPTAPILAPTPAGKTYLLYLSDTALMAQEFDGKSGDGPRKSLRAGRSDRAGSIPALKTTYRRTIPPLSHPMPARF